MFQGLKGMFGTRLEAQKGDMNIMDLMEMHAKAQSRFDMDMENMEQLLEAEQMKFDEMRDEYAADIERA